MHFDARQLADTADLDSSSDGTAETQNTLDLRIAAVFVIFAAGIIGSLPPLFMKVFRNADGAFPRLVRAFSAGIILSLAVIHVMPEAVEDLADLGGIEYPLGGTCVLFGVVLMVLLEHAAHIMHAPQHGSGSGGNTRVRDTADSSMPCAPAGAVAVPPICSSIPAKAAQHDDGGVPADLEADVGHRHVCVSRGSASNWLSAANVAELEGGLRLRVLAYMFELGCIAHSVIIGVGLGINKTDRSEVTALLIALSFHQWLEGISLASVIVRGGVALLHGLAMVLAYSLTCPVGIAIGIAIASSYDAESDKTRALQGTFNGVSSGMLLYIALVQLLAEDMGRFTPGRANAAIRLGCFAALCCGAACMCLLAVWA